MWSNAATSRWWCRRVRGENKTIESNGQKEKRVINKNDIILMCSDGLTNKVSEEEIYQIT